MDSNKLANLMAHSSVQLAAGIIIGAWLGVNHSDWIKPILDAPIAGLVASLASVFIMYQQNGTTPPPEVKP